MPKPQSDGYDTDMVLLLAEKDPPPWQPRTLRRDSPTDAIRFADCVVTLDNTDPLLPSPRWQPVSGRPINLERAIAYVERWPEVARQWPKILHTLQCFTDTQPPESRLYSASHSVSERFGVIALTVDCPLATAQAIVHEMAHAKLRVMGVDNEKATRIIANPGTDLFPSPIVVDEPRPMTAVLHAQYSFIHVTQLDLFMLECENDPVTRSDIRVLLARNLSRMKAGLPILRQSAKPGRDGGPFLNAFIEWCEAVIGDGNRALGTANV